MKDSILLSEKYGVNPTIPICFWCGQEKNEIALMGKVTKDGKEIEMPRHTVIDYAPCDQCSKAMSSGFTVMEATTYPNANGQPEIQPGIYPTGRFVVISYEAAHRLFTELKDDVTKAFLEAPVFEHIFGAHLSHRETA